MKRVRASWLVIGLLLLLPACRSGPGSGRPGAIRPATTTTGAAPTSTAPPVTVPPTTALAFGKGPHVMLIVLENREYGDVVGNPSAPFINGLTRRYGSATNLFAASHPSLPNYLELLAGTTFGVSSDCTSCSVEGSTFTDQLDGRGVAWAAFMEGMPSPCFTGAGAGGKYAKKHNPFMYVRHLVGNGGACARVQPSDALPAALNAANPPDFIWLTPDLCQDGHDCPLATTDSWLRDQLGQVQGSPWYREGGSVIVTWDEGTSGAGCCGNASGGHIATIVVREGMAPGARVDSPVSQAGILATLEDLYGVSRLGDAACACSGNLDALFG